MKTKTVYLVTKRVQLNRSERNNLLYGVVSGHFANSIAITYNSDYAVNMLLEGKLHKVKSKSSSNKEIVAFNSQKDAQDFVNKAGLIGAEPTTAVNSEEANEADVAPFICAVEFSEAQAKELKQVFMSSSSQHSMILH